MRYRWYGGAVPVAGVFVLALVACTSYLTTLEPIEDEILIKLVADPVSAYDHPVHLTAQDLTTILQHVRVEYKAGWLQNFLTGALKPLPLFDPQTMTRVVPPLVRAFEQASPPERIVFYVAERRSEVHREVTTGSLFVTGRLMHIVLSNYRNGVDVVPGIPAYDRGNPEIAVTPQRFTLVFARPEFVVGGDPGFMQGVFEAVPPNVVVDYRLFLSLLGRQAGLGSAPAVSIPDP